MVLGVLRLPEKVVGRAVLEGVERAVDARWDLAVRRAAQTARRPHAHRIDELESAFLRELAAVGAASGGVAALPGAGTGTALAVAGADIGWYTMRLADLILTVAAVHGHQEPTVQERRAWVLSVLTFGSNAAGSLDQVAREVGKGLGARSIGSLSGANLTVVNRNLTTRLIRRYGIRRGAAAFGKLLPFGIGAVIGGVGNAAGVRAVARDADQFFGALAVTA